MDSERTLEEIQKQLKDITEQYVRLGHELSSVSSELAELKKAKPISAAVPPHFQAIPPLAEKNVDAIIKDKPPQPAADISEFKTIFPPPEKIPRIVRPPKEQKPVVNMEQFIGENLFSKIGIIVLILGVAIGIKYTIEHNLITPATRIVLGYLTGLALAGTALRLKKQYFNYSAVLISGAMAIAYFDTYAANVYYELIPRPLAFIIMTVLTVLTVALALYYDREVIAVIGLVGAYAVPFLLNDNSGKVLVLFIYILIINAGILFIAHRKAWRSLTVLAFCVTWLSYLSWFLSGYDTGKDFTFGFVFLTLFTFLFYTVSYFYCNSRQISLPANLYLYAVNSLIFYCLGLVLLGSNTTFYNDRALFTILNAGIHGLAGYYLNRHSTDTKDQQNTLFCFTFFFITIAVPIQYSGNTVTILWALWMLSLFLLSRLKKVYLLEAFSFIMLFITFFSLVDRWTCFIGLAGGINQYIHASPLLNGNFGMNCVTIGCLVIMYKKMDFPNELRLSESQEYFHNGFRYIVPALLLLITYIALFTEISMPFDQRFTASNALFINGEHSFGDGNYDIINFKYLTLIDYTVLFFACLSLDSLRRSCTVIYTELLIAANCISIFLVFIIGEPLYTSLQNTYLTNADHPNFYSGWMNIAIRYVTLLLGAGTVILQSRLLGVFGEDVRIKRGFGTAVIIILLWWLSAELFYICQFFRIENADRYLTLLWGVYAISLLIYGIRKNGSHIRLCGFAIFGLALVKLFFNDIFTLSTVLKTIIFVITGLLLLMSSFLYNKYKKYLFPDNKS